MSKELAEMYESDAAREDCPDAIRYKHWTAAAYEWERAGEGFEDRAKAAWAKAEAYEAGLPDRIVARQKERNAKRKTKPEKAR